MTTDGRVAHVSELAMPDLIVLLQEVLVRCAELQGGVATSGMLLGLAVTMVLDATETR